jgi:hypothetical protein
VSDVDVGAGLSLEGAVDVDPTVDWDGAVDVAVTVGVGGRDVAVDDVVGAVDGAAKVPRGVPGSTGGKVGAGTCRACPGSAATGTTMPAPFAYNRSSRMTSST